MPPRSRGGDAAAGCACEEPQPYEERLSELLDRLTLFGDGDGERLDADRSPAEAATQGTEHGAVKPVEAKLINFVQRQGVTRDIVVNDAAGAYFGIVTYPTQQAIGDARCAA